MSKTRTIAAGLSVAAALLMLSACQSSNEYSATATHRVDKPWRAGLTLRAPEPPEMEAAANQCTATCQEVQVRAQRAFQQSQTK